MPFDDKIKKFFLEGATEPVVLEFSISTSNNDDEILHVLSENGLQVTTNENESDKILVDKTAIITPPLKPTDVIPIYEILEEALNEAKCTISSTPHLIDLKSITPRCNLPVDLELEQKNIRTKYRHELTGEEKSFEEHMINEALSSDRIITLPFSHKAEIPPEIFQGYNRNELLFSGSTIADPYRTATQKIERNVRMASSDLIDAIRYSHPENKTICKYELYAGDKKYGFFHIYKASPEQCYYDGVGIELGGRTAYRGCDCEETMVNRFKNPCVAEYLTFKEVKDSQVYYKLFLIPQNDERWRDFKKLLIHPNDDRLFSARYNKLYAQKNNPQAIIPLVTEAYDEKGYKPDFTTKRIEKIRKELLSVKRSIESILKDIDEMSKKGREIATSEISLDEKKCRLRKIEEESKKKEKGASLLRKSLSRYNPIGKISVLKAEIENLECFCSKVKALNFYSVINNLEKVAEDRRILRQKNIDDIQRYIRSGKKIPENLDLSFLEPQERKNMLGDIKIFVSSPHNTINANIIENSLNLYTSAQSIKERQSLFEYMSIIRLHLYQKDKRLASDISKQIGNKPKFKEFPEIRHLFKSNNIFINHTAKARTIIYNLSKCSSEKNII